jgi:hypothetical protein
MVTTFGITVVKLAVVSGTVVIFRPLERVVCFNRDGFRILGR